MILGGGLWYTVFKLAPRYGSVAKLRASGYLDDADSINIGAVDARQLDEIETFIQNEIRNITSDRILEATVVRPLVEQTEWRQQFDDFRDAALALQEDHLKVSGERGTTLLRLQLEVAKKKEAQLILEELIKVYLTSRQTFTRSSTSELLAIHQAEKSQAEIKINQLREESQNFLSDNEITQLQQGRSSADIEFANLVDQRLEIQMALEQVKGSMAMYVGEDPVNAPLDPNRPMTDSEKQYLGTIPAIAGREEQVRQLNEEIRTQKSLGRGEGHLYVKKVMERLSSVEEELEQQRAIELGEVPRRQRHADPAAERATRGAVRRDDRPDQRAAVRDGRHDQEDRGLPALRGRDRVAPALAGQREPGDRGGA